MTRAFLLAATLLASPVLAHEWYPQSCCNDQDCAPIALDRLQFTDTGIIVPSGELLLYSDERIKQTPIDQEGAHWCYYRDDYQGDSSTLCLFIPNMGA